MATILNTRGDLAFYRGDLKDADQFYQSALRRTSHIKDADTIAQSRLNVAKMAIAQGRSKEALAMLRPLLNSGGATSAYLSLRSAIASAEAEVGSKDYTHAQRDLEQSLTATEKAGMRLDLARIYSLLGQSARLGGTADRSQASYYYGEAVRLLDSIRSDPGAEKVLDRKDLKAIYDDANHWK
jgi:tetratricopeptide (TPR) repeat protein